MGYKGSKEIGNSGLECREGHMTDGLHSGIFGCVSERAIY